MEKNLTAWTRQISTPEAPITPYFIRVNFNEVTRPQTRLFLNKIPTSFSLSEEQVEKLIESARDLLRENPVFQQLLSDINKP
jgi:NTE family protein